MKVASGLLVLLASGCRTGRPVVGAAGPLGPAVELRGDPDVEARLESSGAITSRAGEGTVLRMTIANKSHSTLAFAWSVEWFDRSGKLVAVPAQPWTPMVLAPGASRPIEIPVPTPDATWWRLRAVRPS
jgi:hypothetical protein